MNSSYAGYLERLANFVSLSRQRGQPNHLTKYQTEGCRYPRECCHIGERPHKRTIWDWVRYMKYKRRCLILTGLLPCPRHPSGVASDRAQAARFLPSLHFHSSSSMLDTGAHARPFSGRKRSFRLRKHIVCQSIRVVL